MTTRFVLHNVQLVHQTKSYVQFVVRSIDSSARARAHRGDRRRLVAERADERARDRRDVDRELELEARDDACHATIIVIIVIIIIS